LKRFRIGYFSHPPHRLFDETAAADPALEVLRIPPEASEAAAIEALAGCHGYFAMAARDELPRALHVTSELLERLPGLLMVGSYGAGYDTIEPAACTAAGVLLVNQAGGNAQAVAEHAVGMMLALLRRMPEAHAAMAQGRAQRREAFIGRELNGRTVGIVGLGNTGGRVAAILNAGFGCRVLAVDPYLDAATCAARGAEKLDMPRLLAECDIVSLHCPLTPETRGLFSAAAFAAMRPGTVFITAARGSVHDEAALHAALASGHIAAAGLDVWELEPPAPDHPLLSLPNVIATPHIAGVTGESRARIGRMAAEAFSDFAAGRVPPRVVNPEAVARGMRRRAAVFGD
jgi:D-3-phosphoglycerate dehydrogenase